MILLDTHVLIWMASDPKLVMFRITGASGQRNQIGRASCRERVSNCV